MAEKGWYTDFDESKVIAEKQRKFAVKKSIEKDMENTAASWHITSDSPTQSEEDAAA